MPDDKELVAEEPHLQRSLKNRHIQLIAIGGAIGTGLFMGSGRTVSYAGPSLLLIYLLIGAMLFIMMRAMGELLLHDLNYRSFQDFAGDLLGPWAGFFAGWTYWIMWVVTATAEIIVIVGYFDFWIHDLRWSMVATFVLLLGLLWCNLLTVKLFGEIEFWFALIKIVAIVALIVVGIVLIAIGFTSPDGTVASVTYLWDRGGVFPTGVDGFLKAFQIAVFAFIGIELIGTAAAETADPHKTLPKAINAIPIRIVLFYVLALAIIMTVTPWDKVNPDISPFVNLFSLVGFASAAGAMNFIVLTSASSSANSGIFSTSRMLYGLSTRGQASKSLTKLSSRNIPARALFMSVGLTMIAFPILIIDELLKKKSADSGEAERSSVMAAFEVVSTVSVGLVIFMWSLILVCYIKYRKTRPEAHAAATFRVPGAAFTPWLVLAFFVFVVYVLLREPDTQIALLLTMLWFVGLTVAWFMHKRLHRSTS